MTTLTHEAERRYIAACLNQPQETSSVLTAEDFSHSDYATIYQATVDIRALTSHQTGDEFLSMVANQTHSEGYNVDELKQLRAEAPANHNHIASYAHMISSASFAREMTDVVGQASPEPEPHMERVYAALARHSRANTALFETAYESHATKAEPRESTERIRAEETIAATVLVYPEQARALVDIIPPENLSDVRCKTVYEEAAAAAWHGEKINDLDLIWAVSKAQTFSALIHGTEPKTYTENEVAFVHRLHHTPMDQRSGIEAAKTLISQEIKTAPQQHENKTIRQATPVAPSDIETPAINPGNNEPPPPDNRGPRLGGGAQ